MNIDFCLLFYFRYYKYWFSNDSFDVYYVEEYVGFPTNDYTWYTSAFQ